MERCYEPQVVIDPKTYPFLVRWGKANGYWIKTNPAHNQVYDVAMRDPIQVQQADGHDSVLTRTAVLSLVESLENDPICQKGIVGYKPSYNPEIRINEDTFTDYFMPYTDEEGMDVNVTHYGVFWNIHRVEVQGKGGMFPMCRSEVTAMLRDLEFGRRHVPYFVRYRAGSTTKEWNKGLDTFEKCVARLEQEKPRHVGNADWRIYRELTAALRNTEDIPDNVETPEGWLLLRQWHPGERDSDYLSIGEYENLKELRADMLKEEAFDCFTLSAIYACVHHDPPPKTAAEPAIKWHPLGKAGAPDQITGLAVLHKEGVAGIEAVLYTSVEGQVESVDLHALNAAIRSTHIGESDRALVFPVYRLLKLQDGVQFEKFADGMNEYKKIG